jgi:ribosome-associated toxin RatA of RatAB toxin-antitoxin module
MSAVEKRHLVRGASPADVYAVAADFEAYPRLFSEIKAARIVERRPPDLVRVEFRAEVVLPVRYVLDLRCDPQALTIDWTFVEGEVITDSQGSWRFLTQPDATEVIYRVALAIKAPLPGFLVRKATDMLVAASIPGMFAAIEAEVRRRRSPGT